MANTNAVCSMCGDVGFADKLFRCLRCRFRLQHSYCTNYYEEEATSETAEVCDWCISEERSSSGAAKRGIHQPKNYKLTGGMTMEDSSSQASSQKTLFASHKIELQRRSGDREESRSRGAKSSTGPAAAASPKPSGRRTLLACMVAAGGWAGGSAHGMPSVYICIISLSQVGLDPSRPPAAPDLMHAFLTAVSLHH
ncbi:hypothetical protein Cni_G15778 [Canna indica]|uniref:PHD-type zinc finger plants domain-containing protein n=1 Tax=Canna indica TaxID=4628 RepID=A0AAQ3KEW4_9LILI|nr:hypothetical protein Cni_G15778 [Canna indica]